MTVWVAVPRSRVRHGYRNDEAGMPSMCGRGKHPGNKATDRALPYCQMCAMTEKPPNAPVRASMYDEGGVWSHQKHWVKTGSRRIRDYQH